jgi:dTDP-4-dehydrorhamnose reductase
MVGRSVVPMLISRGHDILATDIRAPTIRWKPDHPAEGRLDVRDKLTFAAMASAWRAEAIVHLAAMTNMEECERLPNAAWLTNAIGAQNAAHVARRGGLSLVAVSTSTVFDGELPRAYNELDTVRPISAYGKSKAAGERKVFEILPDALILRAGWMAGGGANVDHKFVGRIVQQLVSGETKLRAVNDRFGSLTCAPCFAECLANLIMDSKSGIYHLVNRGYVTRYNIACAIVEYLGFENVEIWPTAETAFADEYSAPRPKHEMLDDCRLRLEGTSRLAEWRTGLMRYLREWY